MASFTQNGVKKGTKMWVEIFDPHSNSVLYINPEDGDCRQTRPTNELVREKDPNGEWWELVDEESGDLYYYNPYLKLTEWEAPKDSIIICAEEFLNPGKSSGKSAKKVIILPNSDNRVSKEVKNAKEALFEVIKSPLRSSYLVGEVMLGSSTSQDTHEKKDRPLSSDKTTSDSFRVSTQSIALEIFKNDLESRASDCDDVSVSDEKSFLLGWEDYLNRGMVASEEAICNAPNQIDDTKSKAELTNSNLEISKDIMFDDINEDLENILKLDSQLIMGSQGNFDNLCQNSDVDTLKMEHYRPSTESHNKVKPPSLKITTKKQHKPEEDEDAASSVYSLEQPKKKLESLAEFLKSGKLDEVLGTESKTKMVEKQNRKDHIDSGLVIEDESSYFNYFNFASRYFVEQKGGLFRRRLSKEQQFSFTTDAISYPLTDIPKPRYKHALNSFIVIQQIMGDRPSQDMVSYTANIQFMIKLGLKYRDLHNEMYCQLCKQLVRNRNWKSLRKGWLIMAVIASVFVPNDVFFKDLITFLSDQSQRFKEHSNLSPIYRQLRTIIVYTHAKLLNTKKFGGRSSPYTITELEYALKAPMRIPLFGVTLDDIMKVPAYVDSKFNIPFLLRFLIDRIIELKGLETEGIFRIPGYKDLVITLRMMLEAGESDFVYLDDVNVYASLLKEWLRELLLPLIPINHYLDCIQNSSNVEMAHRIISQLSPLHYRTTKYLLDFLSLMTKPEISSKTKMNASNLALVFSPCFLRPPTTDIKLNFANAPKEQEFIATLLLNPPK